MSRPYEGAPATPSVLNDRRIEAVVGRVTAESEAQEAAIGEYFARRGAAGELSWDGLDEQSHRFMADKLVAFQLRPGAVVVADNTVSASQSCGEYFAYLRDEKNGFRTQTLPFEGGLELSVKC